MPSPAARAGRSQDAELQALVARCWAALADLVAAFDDPAQPYLSQPHPGRAPRFSDYAQLARVAEWAPPARTAP